MNDGDATVHDAPVRNAPVRDADTAAMVDWDAVTVDARGGHVYQSRAWAEHRAASGWTPRFLVAADGGRALALTRGWPVVGGGSAYVPRGPVAGGADPAAQAARLIAVADALAGEGIDVVAADPEVPASESAFRTAIEAAGFAAIEEIQPSRHRVSLPLGAGVDETGVFDGIAKSTRQRVRGAERGEVAVVRHDARVGLDGVGEGFVLPAEPPEAALDRFYDLLLETGERRHFTFGPRAAFVRWWLAALAAGHLVYLEARAGGASGEPLAGLILYRHGGRLSTVHSGDHEAARTTHPGALHLLRWRAIQLAIRERCAEMDLGGVDTAGARGEPQEGDPLYGLYQHKRSFGGQWLALTGAHERVYDARGYQAGRLTGRLARVVRR
ncbi:MAG TPA: GNAT family N-acetyltransferase [Candidatus Limnocylindrales bacterium]